MSLLDTVAQNAPGRMVSVRFEKSNGALGIYTMVLADYGGVLSRDLAKVEALTVEALQGLADEIGQTLEDLQTAAAAVHKSIIAALYRRFTHEPTKGSYTMPIEGYEDAKGLRQHKSGDGRVYVAGMCIAYHHLRDGEEEEKEDKRRATTIAKDAIRAGLSRARWRHLPGGQIVSLKADGVSWAPAHDGRPKVAF